MAELQNSDYPLVTNAVDRLTAVFSEMPGTRLSVAEAARLCGVEVPICGIILGALRDAGFLKQKSDGMFIRRGTDSPGS
jgi:hypothetical protein